MGDNRINRFKDMNPRHSESDFIQNAIYCRSSKAERPIRSAHISYPKPNHPKQSRSVAYRPNDLKPSVCDNTYVNSSPVYSNQNTSDLRPGNRADKGLKSEKKSIHKTNEWKEVKQSQHLEHIWSGLPLHVWQSLVTSQSSNVALCGRESSSDTSSAEVLSSLHSSSDFDSSSSEEDGFRFTGLSYMTSFKPLSYTIVD